MSLGFFFKQYVKKQLDNSFWHFVFWLSLITVSSVFSKKKGNQILDNTWRIL